MAGQTTPQSLSRESSNSSLTQQPVAQWKGDERVHENLPPNAANPSMVRNFPSSRGIFELNETYILENACSRKVKHLGFNALVEVVVASRSFF